MRKSILALSCAVSLSACSLIGKNNVATDSEYDEAFAGCRNYFFQSKWRSEKVPVCPGSEGLVLLPPTFPPGLIFLGYSPQPSHVQFLRELIEKLVEDESRPQVAILVPRLENSEVYRLFNKFLEPPYADFVRFIPVPTDEALWVQDYFEVAVSNSTGRGTIFDLPHVSRDEDSTPAAVALSCQMGYVAQESLPKSKDYPGHGDFGGNIAPFPGNLIVAGNNLTATTQKVLDVNLAQDLMTVNTAWGDPGMVNEIFGVLRVRAQAADQCDFAITHAAPRLALELIKASKSGSGEFQISPPIPEGKDAIPVVQRDDFSPCMELIAQDKVASAPAKTRKLCEELLKANETYAQIIDEGLTAITEEVKKRTNCAEIKTVPLPLVFAPERIKAKYGQWDDHAVNLNPNPVNSIPVGPLLVVPRQILPTFHDDVERKLKSLGLDLHYIDGSFVHYLKGGIQSTSSVVRMCRPQPGTPNQEAKLERSPNKSPKPVRAQGTVRLPAQSEQD